jgi:hypothetical protein
MESVASGGAKLLDVFTNTVPDIQNTRATDQEHWGVATADKSSVGRGGDGGGPDGALRTVRYDSSLGIDVDLSSNV